MNHDGRLAWFLVAVPLLITVLAYSAALHGPLFFDDFPNLIDNPPLHIDGWEFDAWRTAATSSDAGPLLRPIAMLSFAVNYVVAGDFTPFSLKLVNLAFHILTAALVYFLALKLFRSPVAFPRLSGRVRLAAFVVAAIWVLHPLHVSTVAYAVQRMAQLSTLFTIMGLLVFAHYRLRWTKQPASIAEIVAVALWLLMITGFATLSKENGALLPWLVIVVEVSLFQGRWNGVENRPLIWTGWILLLLPIVLMALILLISPEIFTAGYERRDFTMVERLMTQTRLLWYYVGWIFLPDITAMGFQHDDIAVSRGLTQPLTTLFAILAWITVLVFALVLRRRYPIFLFALLFFLVGHAMESSVLALEMAFEHRNYLPSVGVCFLIAYLLTSSRLWRGNRLVFVPTGVVIAALSILLFFRAQVWSSQFQLAYSNVVNHPGSSNAQFFYAEALLQRYKDIEKDGTADSAAADQGRELILGVRQHLLLALQKAPGDIATIVMLIYVDSYFFPELPMDVSWKAQLEASLEGKVLQASDISALSLLVECAASSSCLLAPAEVDTMLGGLIERNPGLVDLFVMKYQLMSTLNMPHTERLKLLREAALKFPIHPAVQSYSILEMSQQGDITGMYELVGKWMALDIKRHDLPSIAPLFSPSKVQVIQNTSSESVAGE